MTEAMHVSELGRAGAFIMEEEYRKLREKYDELVKAAGYFDEIVKTHLVVKPGLTLADEVVLAAVRDRFRAAYFKVNTGKLYS